MYSTLALFGLASTAWAEEAGCTITAKACRNFPELNRKQFRDTLGEEHLGVGSNEAACLKRAEDFHHWCGNAGGEGAQVAATYNPAEWTQVYHPGACDAGWSQWDAFCYKHYWEKRNWFEAERLCRDRNSHLASIHSRAENRFIYSLTGGLSAWIGYSDLDQDTHYQWSDSTQDDFSNFAKNCTGRENEPDCKPEERKQQWYDWQGDDAGTFICKRNALLPVALLKNVSSSHLVLKPWSALLPWLKSDGLPEASEGVALGTSLPELKLEDTVTPVAPLGTAARSGLLEPKLAMPKASLF